MTYTVTPFPVPANNPLANRVLRDLRDGPQRLSELRTRYGWAVTHTISSIKHSLPPNYKLVTRQAKVATKFGLVRDFVYTLRAKR